MSRTATPLRQPWAGPLGLFHPGTSPLHRAPAWSKLLGLLLLGVVTVVLRGPLPALVLLGLAVLAAATARLPLHRTSRGVAPVLLSAVLIGAYQWWSHGWPAALEVCADLLALVLAAVVVTATTRSDTLLAMLTRAARPLARVGLAPETVALTVALMLRAIPSIVSVATEARDAARARGLGRSPRAVLVPAAVRMVAHAHRTGDALAARGIGE